MLAGGLRGFRRELLIDRIDYVSGCSRGVIHC